MEASLGNIAEQHMSYQQFLTPLPAELHALVEQAKQCDSQVFSSY